MNGPLDGPGEAPADISGTALVALTERHGARSGRPLEYRSAFQAAPLAMAVVDHDGRIVTANRALGTLLGTTPAALTGIPAAELAGLNVDGRTRAAFQNVLHGRSDRVSCAQRLKRADGHTFWAEITVVPVDPPGPGEPTPAAGGVALLSLMDVTERRDLQERLRHLQMHDPVTRLPNRALFFERLSLALTESATGRIGLCYLDLDGFKAINDTLGHRIGDRLLDAVARRLVEVAGEPDGPSPVPSPAPALETGAGARAEVCGAVCAAPDDGGSTSGSGTSGGDATGGGAADSHGHLVARLGGDEFAVLVAASKGTEQLTRLAEKVLAALQRPFDVSGQRLAVSASIGVVEREAAGASATGLMQEADTTLYWAKADGRARWTLFDPERNAHRMTRQALSSTVRPALERGEFALEYQPIVGLDDNSMRGVEALVRWRHPQFGTLGPNRFIGLAEENGTIVPLGRWVLAESCRQARRWQLTRPGPPPYVSVNVAVRQVWDSDLVADVAAILTETGLPPGLLQLELTESAVMGSAGRPLEALQALSDMGVSIAIDDFGTGYSNLAYLSRLPVRALKLDGTFVRSFSTARRINAADETIVTSLVQLAHKLGLTVTAECVEGPTQAERLRRIGCDTGQGWHYSRPVSADRIDALLEP